MVGEDGFQWTMTPVEPGGFFRRDDGGASKSAKTSLEDEPCASVAQRLGGYMWRRTLYCPFKSQHWNVCYPIRDLFIKCDGIKSS